MSFGPFFAGEKYTFTLSIVDKDTGDVVTLSGQTAKVHLRKKLAIANRHTGADEDATFTDPPGDGSTGKIDYTLPTAWAVGEVSSWTLQVSLTQGAVIRKTEKIDFQVESGL